MISRSSFYSRFLYDTAIYRCAYLKLEQEKSCKPVDIEKLSTKLPNIIYEPEQFPAAIYYAKELEGTSILIFASGKVVIAGLRSERLVGIARRVLAKLESIVDEDLERSNHVFLVVFLWLTIERAT